MPEVEMHSIAEKKLLHKFAAHEKRVRCLKLIKGDANEDEGKNLKFCLVTASNDGNIKVWKGERKGDKFDVCLAATHDTKCRVTCMAVHKVSGMLHDKKIPQY
jgi:WD40 repeat protein